MDDLIVFHKVTPIMFALGLTSMKDLPPGTFAQYAQAVKLKKRDIRLMRKIQPNADKAQKMCEMGICPKKPQAEDKTLALTATDLT